MHRRTPRIAAACVAALLAALPALAQQNPAARGTVTTARTAMELRFPPGVTETAVTGASPFSAACGDNQGTVYIGAEVEPHIAANPLNPNHLVGAWQQDRYSNGGARGQGSGVSFDGGRTWARSAIVASVCGGGEYARATDPWVAFGADGAAYQATLAISGATGTPSSISAIMVARSEDGGLTWGTPVTVARDTGLFFNDKESITADPADARFIYAVWDRLLPGDEDSAAVFSRTTDGGASWEPAREFYIPAGGGSTIGHVIRVLPNGTLVDLFTQFVGNGPPTLNVMRSTDRGVTWSGPILVSNAAALGTKDPETNTAVRDGGILPEMAVAPDGTLYIVWQDARFTQVRDGIALSRSTDGGLTWSVPVRVNGNPNVQAFTPQVHVRADGTIGVTYYDLRSNTADAATLMADFWLSRSTDGVNWTELRVSPPFNLNTAPFAGGWFVGDYTGLTSSGTTFVALYARTTGNPGNRNDVFAARIGTASGTLDAKRVLAEEAVAETYRAAPLPDWQPDARFWRAVSDNAAAALARRYLKVQRYTASSPGR